MLIMMIMMIMMIVVVVEAGTDGDVDFTNTIVVTATAIATVMAPMMVVGHKRTVTTTPIALSSLLMTAQMTCISSTTANGRLSNCSISTTHKAIRTV